ncbi:MAG: 16S rRNA (uracil(1498)-N(3))-methyltransferase [Prevotellaceae bacterium]|jgi:16S rRNA (uracil1498-N3)-methyltransferase|nr:16S rRNA (uracil(1498)-N(3))-methyltransferase [Prevotellaceae bacterium]
MFLAETIAGEYCTLSPEESRHCISVLRHVRGDTVTIFDRHGATGAATIVDSNPNRCRLEIISTGRARTRSGRLHVAIAPVKSAERFEWFVEKAVEIGIEEITPVVCERSERRTLKMERIEKIVVSAMKQSLNLWFPRINPLVEFPKFIGGSGGSGTKCIAHCEEKTTTLHAAIDAASEALILIGPEGDFSPREIDAGIAAGFVPVTLGTSRLRTETAGVAACAAFLIVNC